MPKIEVTGIFVDDQESAGRRHSRRHARQPDPAHPAAVIAS